MKPRHAGAALAPIGLLVLIGTIVWHSGGGWGFRALLNLEAFVFVTAGTALLVWAAYPITAWRKAEAAEYAARSAAAMGVLGTLLGMIMMLADVVDFAELPKRTALALSALFFGLLLSRAVLLPRSVLNSPR